MCLSRFSTVLTPCVLINLRSDHTEIYLESRPAAEDTLMLHIYLRRHELQARPTASSTIIEVSIIEVSFFEGVKVY